MLMLKAIQIQDSPMDAGSFDVTASAAAFATQLNVATVVSFAVGLALPVHAARVGRTALVDPFSAVQVFGHLRDPFFPASLLLSHSSRGTGQWLVPRVLLLQSIHFSAMLCSLRLFRMSSTALLNLNLTNPNRLEALVSRCFITTLSTT